MSEWADPSVKILKYLKSVKDQYVSGEELSDMFGMSRTAIWKRMESIKEEGFNIEAVTKKGYRLIKEEPACVRDAPYGRLAIQSELSGSAFGHDLKFLQETDSTNQVLKKMAAQNAPEGTVVISEMQSAGRGRRGRAWWSSPNRGIWMSILLRPNLHPSSVQTLTLAASLAVMQALKPFKIDGMGIKWPNDILINGKKVCGILTELSAEAEKVDWVIIGIGLNVNHSEADFPDDISSVATSLRMNVTKNALLDRSVIAANIIDELEKVYRCFLEKGPAWVVHEWKKYNITLGKRIKIINQQGEVNAEAIDITEEGRLIVRDENGNKLELYSGEISIRET